MDTNQTFTGPLIVSGRGYGYFKQDQEHTFEIQPDKLHKAFHLDMVEVRVLPDLVDNKVQAEVVSIISRTKTKYVGTVEKNDSHCFLKADSNNMYVDIYLGKDECTKANDKDKVLVEITEWSESHNNPTGKIVEVLGPKGQHEVEMRAIVLDRGFETSFPDEVEMEAQKLKDAWHTIPQEEIEKRTDMRNETTFTIDPFNAKDFDDALSVTPLPNGNYKIGVHIADVSHYVRPGSALDREASDRSFSVYLVDRTIPMLPEVLSNDLCSLNPNEDKLSFSTVFEITPDGDVLSEWYGRTVIKSDKRFTYEEAQRVLDEEQGDYKDELFVLRDISRILRKKKMENGAIRFEKDEFEFELDDKGVPLRIFKREHIETHGLIEEFMLLANRHVARYIEDTSTKRHGNVEQELMYRVHQPPQEEKIRELKEFVGALGYKLEIKKDGTISPQAINAFLDAVKGKPEESLLSSATIKTMSKAIYDTHDLGHFGLAFDHYTHFTSPIRRYPDLVVHRILDALLKNKDTAGLNASPYGKIATHATEQEIAAQDAERSSIKYKQVEFMQNHIGDTFTGIVSGVMKFGIFVVLDDNGAQGMVHISKLGDEYFTFEEKKYRVVGERTHKTYTLGDVVTVKVDAANIEEQKLELSLVK